MSSMKPLPPSPPPPSSTRRTYYDTRNSKKRLFSATPNSSFLMDPEVIEIPPPIPSSFNFNKKKQVVIHEVIDVENDEDSSDVMILDEMVDVRNKGKAVKGSPDVYSPIQAQDFVVKHLGSINKVEPSKHSTEGSHNVYNLEGDLAYDDDFLDNYCVNDFLEVDEYATMQTHFDNFDIPAGVEASVPWFPEFSESKNNISHANTQSSVNGNDQSHLTWLSEPAHVNKKPASVSSSSFLTPVDPISHSPGGAGVTSTFLFPQGSQSKKSVTSQHKLTSQILRGRNIFHQVGGSIAGSIGNHVYSTMPPGPVNPTYWSHLGSAAKTQIKAVGFMPTEATHTMVAEPSMSWWPPPMKPKYNLNKHNVYSSFADPVDGAYITPQEVADIRNQRNVNEADILSKFQLFKQFDTVEDFSDHHYASSGSSTKQPPKNWAKKIQEEWRMLEKDLPDTIFVRVYESRMDLLRAVIIGAEGTPYHDGLFFFDVFFPASYPKAPPHVYYHSGGLRLNPNLYSSGKVCLSLLNTWSGNKNEKWIPGMSTMLQVLVSIQALILNQDPYFNEPGWARHRGTQQGDLLSRQYNEDTFILSLKTMVYSMRRPPKHFEDFAVGHFYMRAQNILVACKAYMDGAQVGCLAKGGIQDVDEGDKSCSMKFKDSVAGCVNMLVKEFTVLGVKDCEKFLAVTKSQNNQLYKVSVL
ncbi:ubiquitin-conjugating enzyme 25, PHO2 FAMILY UBIQUITIN CONJUGATION ENZYME 1 [Hibiscus trionum]|uniref:E2 ubiquitin-conjugating enzyme n=1 Tax=Hibiscus trionum TaxID=183268 RepID=A0A9W7MQ15_HIBTR|nr:ubiquitin-conjugating enzyme 25, PHO2 FAMILY UBIQUITIN CONJUGATION ENZYME 1 [Hibiscus trionum]